ncbi:helix-turn-helix domain-containing protein [Bacillus sp. REN16]|uniref:helix-turn-helix domain-containing protein n=1 Tax=Bacillus sp. REN16 TaxID=2887296 RepID=UPI001E534D63|nr:helix-turn-helix transcriptional regulator [Bacillus sp. REN16]MCC3359125.1 helix-turn-helix domain-containing protein [Bacillus sp. REN16]
MAKLKDEVIGKRIRQARMEVGFSQAELAEGVDMTRAQIGNIETGRTVLSLKDAGLICDFLGLDIKELLDTEESDLDALILFRQGEGNSDEKLIDLSDNIVQELIAQKELFEKEETNHVFTNR